MKFNTCFAHLFLCISLTIGVLDKSFAQNNEAMVAHEYYVNGEYEKAKITFEKLAKKTEYLPVIYNDFTGTLAALTEYNELEKFIKRTAKNFPENIFYKIDHYVVLADYTHGDAEKDFKFIEQYIKNNSNESNRISDYLLKKGKPEKAVLVFIIARKSTGDKYLFSVELANMYAKLGKEDLMIQELLAYLKANPTFLDNVKNSFQNNLHDETGFSRLENVLYEKIQKEPEEISYNELLLWLNVQQKEFGKAFLQARAIDKRKKTEGDKLLEIGKIAHENKDYENAQRYFQAIVTDYKTSKNYPSARKSLLAIKEEIVKNTFPVNSVKIQSLILDYKYLIEELGKNPATPEVLKNMAMLEAFYLDKKDTALVLLEEALSLARYDQSMSARIKLDMGDTYLLKGEPWEATLIYSQVEKAQKDETLGHEAKLRNAKLYYYKGDFAFAQEQLDVLKLATSREIANDAMNLSILIQDNLALDTSTEALREYSAIDLLLFQNKTEEAIVALKRMEEKFKGHSLSDEIIFLEAKIYKKQGNTSKAIDALNIIREQYSQDILGDDALFMLGNLYEEEIKNKEKAMEVYQDFLIKYPGSIFNVEARKRFRMLRGDKL